MGLLRMISSLATSAMMKSQRNADCHIVPSLADCIAPNNASPRRSKLSLSAFSVFWKRLGDIHTKGDEGYVNRFAFLVYLFRSPSVSCRCHWRVSGNAKPTIQGSDGVLKSCNQRISRPNRKFGNPSSNPFKSQRHQSKTQSSLNRLKSNRERQMRLSFVQSLSNRGPSPRSQIKP